MKIIAHRGLMMGPNKETENGLDTIDEALSYGFDVEVDVWCDKDTILRIGHDEAGETVPTWLLNEEKVWWHAKCTESLKYLLHAGKRVFYHTNEDVVMTSKGELWAMPGKGFSGSYIVLPENTKEIIPKDAMGICTDYAIKYRDMYR